MSVDKLTASLRAALSNLPTSTLLATQALLAEIREMVGPMLQGSADYEAHQVVPALTDAIEALGRVHALIAEAERLVNAYIARVGSADVQTSVLVRPVVAPPPAAPVRVDDLRRDLPPRVPTPNPAGKKTHGRWVDAQGRVQTTISGHDETAKAAWELLQRAGASPNRKLAVIDHVEVKVATTMIQTGQRHVDLAVNNKPCLGMFGCDSLLPVLLPEGYTVTVYGPDGYEQTFVGGQEW